MQDRQQASQNTWFRMRYMLRIKKSVPMGTSTHSTLPKNPIYKPEWVPAMVRAINNAPHFRWHDSGDIQSVRHLTKIVRVAELTPDTKHWLPTHEYKMVSTYLKKHGSFPENLIVRMSAAMVDGQPPKRFALTSTIHKNQAPIGYECPAHKQDNECKDCRACWNPEVKNISYEWH